MMCSVVEPNTSRSRAFRPWTPSTIGRPPAVVRSCSRMSANMRVKGWSPSVGGVKEASDYIKLFDYDIGQLTTTFKQVLGR